MTKLNKTQFSKPDKDVHTNKNKLHKVDKLIDNSNVQIVTFIAHKIPHKMWCLNNRNNMLETGNILSVHPDDNGKVYNSCCQYFITGTDIVFTLKSVNKKDISVVADILGNGCKDIAGFSVTLTDFNKFNGFYKLLVQRVLDLDELKAHIENIKQVKKSKALPESTTKGNPYAIGSIDEFKVFTKNNNIRNRND